MAEPSTPVMATPSKNGQTAFTSDFRFVFSLGLGITCVTFLHSYIKNIHKVQQNIVIPCKCCPCLVFFLFFFLSITIMLLTSVSMCNTNLALVIMKCQEGPM